MESAESEVVSPRIAMQWSFHGPRRSRASLDVILYVHTIFVIAILRLEAPPVLVELVLAARFLQLDFDMMNGFAAFIVLCFDLQSGCRTFFESSPSWYPRRMYAARWSWMRSAMWFQFQQKEASQAGEKRGSPGLSVSKFYMTVYVVHIAEPLRWRYKRGTVILRRVGFCRMVPHPCEMDNVFASGSASHSVQAVPAQMPVP